MYMCGLKHFTIKKIRGTIQLESHLK